MTRESRPTVGIALLAYNYGQYIDEALESLKNQTYQDFEVFLIDDGSNDGFTPEKLKNIEYDKITKKLLHKNNIGNARRRLGQYKIMNNKYILDMSGDDCLAPTFLEKTVTFLDSHPKYGAVCVDIEEYENDFSTSPFTIFHYDRSKTKLPEMLSECHFLGSSLMRNKALKKTDLSGGFIRYQDWDRWISMLEAGWLLGVVSEPLFKYRVHSDSLSHSSTPEKETEVFRQIVKKHKVLYEKYFPEVTTALFYKFYEATASSTNIALENQALIREIRALQTENNSLRAKTLSFPRRILRKVRQLKNRTKH